MMKLLCPRLPAAHTPLPVPNADASGACLRRLQHHPLCLFFRALATLLLAGLHARAEQSGDFYYSVVNGSGITITSYVGPGGALAIPKTIAGKPVLRIGQSAFLGNSSLTSVIIPEGATILDRAAFFGCTGLENVELPSSLNLINPSAFSGCTNLRSIIIPQNVTAIGLLAFRNCTALSSVIIQSKSAAISLEAFSGCSSLTSINLPENATSLAEGVFSGCTSLASIAIPGSVVTIEDEAFLGCTALVHATLSPGIQTIKRGAFSGCSILSHLVIPDSVRHIGSYAFSGCKELKNIIIPDSVKSIELGAFSGCSSLSSVFFEGSRESIGDLFGDTLENLILFYYEGAMGFPFPEWQDYGYQSMTVPRLKHEDFEGTSDGINITITNYTGPGGEVTIPSNIAGLPVAKIGLRSFFWNVNLTSVSIPGNGTVIDDFAFQECSSLTRAIIPEGVVSIGRSAFAQCAALTDISIPSSTQFIGHAAFYNCLNLVDVTLKNGITTIDQSAFGRCSKLISIVIPSSVTSVYDSAFADCSNMKSALFEGNAPRYLGPSAFSSTDPEFTVRYYEDSAGFTSPTWMEYPAQAIPRPVEAGELAVASITRESSVITINVREGRQGWVYELKRSQGLGSASWNTVQTVGPLAADGPVILSDSAAATAVNFYRVIGRAL